jgi:hypothetical protein
MGKVWKKRVRTAAEKVVAAMKPDRDRALEHFALQQNTRRLETALRVFVHTSHCDSVLPRNISHAQ